MCHQRLSQDRVRFLSLNSSFLRAYSALIGQMVQSVVIGRLLSTDTKKTMFSFSILIWMWNVLQIHRHLK